MIWRAVFADSWPGLLSASNKVTDMLKRRTNTQNAKFPGSLYASRVHARDRFSLVTRLCLTLCDSMDCSTPGFPVHHQLPESGSTHVHQVGDAIQPSHPLLYPSLAFNLSQHQDLFKWVSSSHQVVEVLELQHQFFQWIFRTDFL